MPAQIINFLWVGSQLSFLEVAALKSHVTVGHQCKLWIYTNTINAPKGVDIADANTIIPEEDIFTSSGGSLGPFADLFRFKLIYEHGGWWCDTDVICLKEFKFTHEYVFSSERFKKRKKKVFQKTNNGIIKCPPQSNIMKRCYEIAQTYIADATREGIEVEMKWGTTGPTLLDAQVKLLQLDAYIQPPDVFCPLNWWNYKALLSSNSIDKYVKSNTVGIHVWNEFLRRDNINKNDMGDDTMLMKLCGIHG